MGECNRRLHPELRLAVGVPDMNVYPALLAREERGVKAADSKMTGLIRDSGPGRIARDGGACVTIRTRGGAFLRGRQKGSLAPATTVPTAFGKKARRRKISPP